MDGREGGYIKLHRRLFSWPLWRSMPCGQRMVWITLLVSANWKDDFFWVGQQRVEVKRGQLAHAENEIAERAGVGRQVARDAIAKLIREGAITREKTLQGNHSPWLITIVNYERFQGDDGDENPRPNQEGTKEEPTGNQRGTLREEGKKERREEEKSGTGAPAPLLLLSAERPPSSKPVKVKKPPDPQRRPTSDALTAAFLALRGEPYVWDDAKDGVALGRLLTWSQDTGEIVRRFRAALLCADPYFRVDTIAAFATSRIWNHFTRQPANGVQKPASPARVFDHYDSDGNAVYQEAKA